MGEGAKRVTTDIEGFHALAATAKLKGTGLAHSEAKREHAAAKAVGLSMSGVIRLRVLT